MKRLEKCPCCGSDAAFVGTVAEIDYAECDEEIPIWAEEHWTVVCDYMKGGCGMSTGRQYLTQQAAIDAWNRRNAREARIGKAGMNLEGKCGGCSWGEEIEFCGSDCYVRCTNPVLTTRMRNGRYVSAIKSRSRCACKRHYEARWIREETE